MAYPRSELNERLILDRVHVDASTGCWLWRGSINADGIGQIGAGGRMLTAPRAAWLVFVGPITPGHWVCRTCSASSCVNPAHHAERTPTEQRRQQGLMLGAAKLTEEQVLAIKARLTAGDRQGDIARELVVSKNTVSAIHTERTWRHVPWPEDP